MTACSAEPSPSAVTVNGCKATEADNGHLSSVEINGGGVAFAVKDSVSMTTSSTSGTMEDDDLRYGCCYTRPAWLQWINNIVGAVWFISLANCLQSLANGLYGVVLSTIERQFDLTSSQSSWIAAGYEMGPIPILILLSILGSRYYSA
jgi:hypothetical protein